jgi:hypothetical protein
VTFITIVGCALGAYIALWAVYLPIAYHFNSDAERDPDDEPIPPWLPELLEMGQLARPMGRGQFQVVHRPPAGVACSKRFTRWRRLTRQLRFGDVGGNQASISPHGKCCPRDS